MKMRLVPCERFSAFGRRMGIVTARNLCVGLLAFVMAIVGVTATASATAGSWGDAFSPPGLIALNVGDNARATEVSCSSSGECSAVGTYTNGGVQGFVADRVGGVWQSAVAIPGLAALNAGGSAQLKGVSCPSDGNCSAVGSFFDGSGYQGFVVDRVGGVWQSAVTIPGLAALNVSNDAMAMNVSCSSVGNCSAAGYYVDSQYNYQLFVIDRVGGVWQNAAPLPGLMSLNQGGESTLDGLSCPSDGNCSAGGYYASSPGQFQGYVVDRVGGVWQAAAPINGLQALNVGSNAAVQNLSCSSAGNCSAVGYFNDGVGKQGFVVDQIGGVWQSAMTVSGISALGATSEVFAVSCASDGNCSAVGDTLSGSVYTGFALDRVGGSWGAAATIPGLGSLGTSSVPTVVSCWSATECTVLGAYESGAAWQEFVADRIAGTWQSAAPVPGLVALNAGGDSYPGDVSCVVGGECSAVGYYSEGASVTQGFILDRAQAPDPTTTTTTNPSIDPAVPVFTG